MFVGWERWATQIVCRAAKAWSTEMNFHDTETLYVAIEFVADCTKEDESLPDIELTSSSDVIRASILLDVKTWKRFLQGPKPLIRRMFQHVVQGILGVSLDQTEHGILLNTWTRRQLITEDKILSIKAYMDPLRGLEPYLGSLGVEVHFERKIEDVEKN